MATRAQLHLDAVRRLPCGVVVLEMTADSGDPSFLAGQYLQLLHPDGTPLSFSVASPPWALPRLELHYQSQSGSDDARRMDELIEQGGMIEATFGHGHCGFEAPLAEPLLIIAGGTGISQARSILLETLDASTHPVRLFWGVKRADDLYLAEALDALAARFEHFAWQPCVEEDAEAHPGADPGRAAECVADLATSEALELDAGTVLLAGGPPMVWGSVETLKAAGLKAECTLADVFEYAPRDDLWD